MEPGFPSLHHVAAQVQAEWLRARNGPGRVMGGGQFRASSASLSLVGAEKPPEVSEEETV